MIERIREIINIKSRGLSEAAFAEKIGMKQQTLNNYIRGVNKLSVAFITIILETFPDVSAEWLMRGEGDMYITDGLPVIRGDESESEEDLHAALARCRAELKDSQNENVKLLGQLEFMEEYNLKVAGKLREAQRKLDELQGEKKKKDII